MSTSAQPNKKKMTFKENVSLGPLDKFIRFSNPLTRSIPMEATHTRHSHCCVHCAAYIHHQRTIVILQVKYQNLLFLVPQPGCTTLIRTPTMNWTMIASTTSLIWTHGPAALPQHYRITIYWRTPQLPRIYCPEIVVGLFLTSQ